MRLATYLTYELEGAPDEKPKEGDWVIIHVFEFPLNKWHVGIAPGFRSSFVYIAILSIYCRVDDPLCSIHVAGTHLSIRVAPPHIFSPFVCLVSTKRV